MGVFNNEADYQKHQRDLEKELIAQKNIIPLNPNALHKHRQHLTSIARQLETDILKEHSDNRMVKKVLQERVNSGQRYK